MGRFELLERSLRAVESATDAWKNRALMAEKMLRLARINGAEIDTSSLPVEQAPSVGRLEVLPGSDVRIKDLLENGPRRETPDWMKRRLQTGPQGLPPMQPIAIEAEIDASIPLQLPSSETVWDVSKSKVKENDKYAVRAAEKEALDLQRNAMERALQTKSTKTLVRYPEDAEEKSGQLHNVDQYPLHHFASIFNHPIFVRGLWIKFKCSFFLFTLFRSLFIFLCMYRIWDRIWPRDSGMYSP